MSYKLEIVVTFFLFLSSFVENYKPRDPVTCFSISTFRKSNVNKIKVSLILEFFNFDL